MRVPNWEDRFYEAIEKHRALPTDYKRSDCFRLMMDVIEAVTGESHYQSDLKAYRTSEGAARRLRKHRYSGVGEAIEALGYPTTTHSLAMRGDVCAIAKTDRVEMEEGVIAGGVVVGNEIVAKGEYGLVRLPREPEHTYFAIR